MSDRTCSIDGCLNGAYIRGWCNAHYLRWQRYGDPLFTLRAPGVRFWKRVNKSDRCWTWTGAKFRSGYGQFNLNGKQVRAHRWSYEHSYGTIPAGMQIDHECRNRLCVNPGHLRLATNKQNQENRDVKRTSKSGVRGVDWLPAISKYRARVRHNGIEHHVGVFSAIEDAEAAVVTKRNELFSHNSIDRSAT